MNVYLDNAATTPVAPEVLEAITEVLKNHHGNPSSGHRWGREAKAILEDARKSMAKLLNCAPAELYFTSGGSEADNTALCGAVTAGGIRKIISSPLEHPAVLNTLDFLKKNAGVQIFMVRLQDDGHIDLENLEALLMKHDHALVSLMHANNEIGNLLPLPEAGAICRKYNSVFHSDTVQSMAHYRFDLSALSVDMATCSAHKFHGPKGTGFLYVQGGLPFEPLIHGGGQERNMRGGTENVALVAGMCEALKQSYDNMEKHQKHITMLKEYMYQRLTDDIPGIEANGDNMGLALYTVLNVHLPPTDKAETLLFNLDINGVAASGGSACASGAMHSSHVLDALGINDPQRPSLRFSFSRYNTKEEVDFAVETLKHILFK